MRKLAQDHKGYGSAARVFSTTFNIILATSFDWWRKQEYLEKTTDLCHESLTNYHPMWYHVHPP